MASSAPPGKDTVPDCSAGMNNEAAVSVDENCVGGGSGGGGSVVEGSGSSSAGGGGYRSSSNVVRTQAWNRPINGVIEAAPVMGADMWPSLSETARTPHKPEYVRSVSSPGEGSMALSLAASSSRSYGTKSARANLNHNSMNVLRHKSTKNHRSSTSNGDRSQQHHPPSSQGPGTEMSSNSSSHSNNSNTETGQRGGSRLQLHSGSNNAQHRRGNGGSNPRGDGARRRNQDNGNRDVNPPQNLSARPAPAPAQPPVFPGPLPRPPLAPFAPPPPFTPVPFMGPPFNTMSGQPLFYGPPPMFGPHPMRPPPFFVPAPEQLLAVQFLKQIDYYFSDANLVKDVFLRAKMDDQGWVPVTKIANFERVKDLLEKAKVYFVEAEKDPIQFTLNLLQNSKVVEVQGDKLRKQSDWQKWILPEAVRSSSSASEAVENGSIVNHLETVTIEEKPVDLSESNLEEEDKSIADLAEQ